MSLWVLMGSLLFALLPLLFLYCRTNDRRLQTTPKEALLLSSERCTPKSVRSLAKQLERSSPTSIRNYLPSKTNRRYIVVGGGGFLGGWIVACLLERGEDPKRIRILDLRPPFRQDLNEGKAKGLQFIKVDLTDCAAVLGAFMVSWTDSDSSAEITVFHTAANIRFFERHESLLPASERINVQGTQHVIDAARAVGAKILLYTSSASIAVHRTRFFLWPWENEPRLFVQVLRDGGNDSALPKRHDEFFSNYAATKMRADRLVQQADRTPSGFAGSSGVLRTGCLRPGNAIYGPQGDMYAGAYLARKSNPSWVSNIVQSCCYVENCVLAHLCYEQRLIEIEEQERRLNQGGEKIRLPDIGGQAFIITDAGSPLTSGDVNTILETLTDGECTFPELSTTMMLIVAHAIEAYYLTRHWLLHAGSSLVRSAAAVLLPALPTDVANLQPSLFALTSIHVVFDDSRARLPPEKGGLGYRGPWTTFEGLHKTVQEHKKEQGSQRRSDIAGISLGFDVGKLLRVLGGEEKRWNGTPD